MTGSSKKEEVSDEETEVVAEGEPEETALTGGESEGKQDVSVNDEGEDSQLAEATIISEDNSRSDEGLAGAKATGGDENETEISEGDGIGSEPPVLKGFAKGAWLLRKFNIGANKRVMISGLFVGLLVTVFMHKAEVMEESGVVDEPEVLPVQMFLASIDDGAHDAFYFDRFLILLEEEEDPAYLMLSIVITPSNKKTYEEVNAKRTICRGIIYEVLKRSVTKRAKFKEYRKTLEKEILKAINRVLAEGGLEQVDLSEFLVV